MFFGIIIFLIYHTNTHFLYVLATSLSDEAFVVSGKVTIYPIGFDLSAYEAILSKADFWVGYKNTLVYTVVGVSMAMIMTIACAYPLSKNYLPGRKFFTGMIVFTMFFGGGLIPRYLLIKSLGFRNTIWAIVIPGCISAFNMIILRSFLQSIPSELEDAAAVDGLNPIRTLIQIVLPLSKPALATITLYYAVAEWNSWLGAFLYLDHKEMHPVTLFLRNIVNGAQTALQQGASDTDELAQIAATVRSATIILVVTPILCVYPFIQKYFVKGVMLGSLKG